MSLIRRAFIFVGSLLMIFAFVACNETSEERTTDMTTKNTTISTDSKSTETTTEKLLEVKIDRIEMVNEVSYSNQLLEFDIFEKEGSETIVENFNPYDYEEIKIVFTFSSPSDDVTTQTAFWYKSYEQIRLIGGKMNEDGFYTDGQEYIDWGDSKTNYRVRINPQESGLWNYTMKLYIKGNLEQSLDGSFNVVEGQETKGYVGVDQVNKRNFVFETSNTTFIPMGSNFAWYRGLGTHDYYNWFKHLNEQNGNFSRIWLSNWSFSLHKYDYDNFDSTQNILARLDTLFNFADEFDVYIMLTLINHGQFSANTNPEWAENPYNIDNGGMLEYPVQFFYNEEAMYHYKNELMYLISRYGYSENIFAWELFNEVDWIDGYSHLVVSRWHKEMASFIKENDPYNHLVSTSYKYTFGTPAFDYEELDFANFHSYAYNDVMFYEKFISEMTSLWDKYQKPVFFGEIGIDWQSGSGTYSSDYTGITIHQGLWSGMMVSAAGANHWWWDSWIERNDLWYRFKGAATYAQYIDVANENYQLLNEADSVLVQGEDIGIIGYLLEDRVYGYIYNNNWNYWKANPEKVSNVKVTIPVNNGEYQLLVFDTITGEIISDLNVVITDGALIIDNLEITTDYAFILK
ncbi:MAG: hypothetical protein RBR50_07520 [Candidatus Izemoplasmatales bacterium]|nr:hypothetical protein [Candidatus Izemoplasmatales bacterium]